MTRFALTLAASLALATPTHSAEHRFGFDSCLKGPAAERAKRDGTDYCAVLSFTNRKHCEIERKSALAEGLTAGPCKPIKK
jgi:hypothetical protein